jgi:cellulose synthase operon protein C
MSRAALLSVLLALPLAAQDPAACRGLAVHGRAPEAAQCFEKLSRGGDPYLRAEGFWGLARYNDANTQFRAAVQANPKNAVYKVRWGRLLLDRFNPDDAAGLFREALEVDANSAGALLGLALVASDSFDAAAVAFAQKAAAADPKLIEARELLARLAVEENDFAKADQEAAKALALSPEALEAMAIRATIDWLSDKTETPWEKRALAVNPAYGELYATAGRLFVLNRRYEEGVAFYRRAVALDPRLWSAHSALGVNLMRLGDDVEARRELELCYASDYRNAATVNSLRLLDSYKNFVVFKTNNTVLKLHKKEAGVLRPYFEAELKRAIGTYERKYGMKLERPVQLEVYPDHEDFAVRTLGMPGLGALGVTFGYSVAMDSPSARTPGSFHWASTLWHELSHVFVLAATHHRVPRWFTEGMSVHEETAVSPEWGDRLSPEVITAIAEKKLLPVAQLDRGFLRPSYPEQVVVSYYQAGRICDYIAREWGDRKLLDMIQSFANRKSTPDTIEEQLNLKPEEFDRRFLAWLDSEVHTAVAGFPEWKKRIRPLAALAAAKKYDDVIREGRAIRDLYPDYVEAASVYEFLADAYLAKGDKPAAAAELDRYAKLGGRSPVSLKKLATLDEDTGRKADAAAALARLNYIYPGDEELHRRLGDLWMAQANAPAAAAEYEALVALGPLDQAGSHLSLARAYRAQGRLEDAKEQVVTALEAAPGYKPAQALLLELSK